MSWMGVTSMMELNRESKMEQMKPDVTVRERTLKDFCTEILTRVEVSQEDAVKISHNLVEADLGGVASHGIVRLPIYVQRIRAGVVNPRPKIRIVRETLTTAVVDGDNGMGQLVGMFAMHVAIDKGRAGECSFVSVRNSNHYGAAAYYSQMAVAHDMVGLTFTIGGINHMTPWGGAEAILGNNPFSIALPAGEEFPVVLDMACSVAARGKIIIAAKDHTPIPNDWAVGPNGLATTDPIEALKGFLSPVAGPKGYALTLVIGLLSTMLSGASFGSEVTHMYNDFEKPQNIGHLFGVLPISSFESIETYKKRMDKAIREIRNVKRAEGVERIYLPGEHEQLLADQYRNFGIPMKRAVFVELQELGRQFGVNLQEHP
jgi:LDH2 family malate/lactate/ureidoglycolate dehydrogenase